MGKAANLGKGIDHRLLVLAPLVFFPSLLGKHKAVAKVVPCP